MCYCGEGEREDSVQKPVHKGEVHGADAGFDMIICLLPSSLSCMVLLCFGFSLCAITHVHSHGDGRSERVQCLENRQLPPLWSIHM